MQSFTKQTTNGWINLYKPKGITSNKALTILKKKFNISKVGHIGTLDPEAEGVLPIAIGEATKTIAFIKNEIKGYEFKILFGIKTDTGDLEGKITENSDILPSLAGIVEIIPKFIGKIKQKPPIYSAIKINGKRSYDLARKGEIFEIEAREVEIYDLKILEYSPETKEALLSVLCSKGTYVRSLSEDIAKNLNTIATTSHIKRIISGVFLTNDTINVEQIEKIVHNDELITYLKAVDFVLDDIPVVNLLTPQTKLQIKNGQTIEVPIDKSLNLIHRVFYENKLIAIGEVKAGFLKPLRVFNL